MEENHFHKAQKQMRRYLLSESQSL